MGSEAIKELSEYAYRPTPEDIKVDPVEWARNFTQRSAEDYERVARVLRELTTLSVLIDGENVVNAFVEFSETTDPAAPATDHARLYARDNGVGKTQLCVRFATGAVQVIATEP